MYVYNSLIIIILHVFFFPFIIFVTNVLHNYAVVTVALIIVIIDRFLLAESLLE
jgi:hypothetical protein